MDLAQQVYALIAGLAFAGIVLLLLRPVGLLAGGRGRLPRSFVVRDLASPDLPESARRPADYLTHKLGALGFRVADLPVVVPALRGLGHRLVLMPYVHEAESTLFFLGIEQHLTPRSDLMLHILTPLRDGGRVETSTLPVLANLVHPPKVELQVVLDADSVDEIWSRHRLALNAHERAARAPVAAADWREHAAAAYEAWLQAGVRAQRLQISADGLTYRVRARPKSFI